MRGGELVAKALEDEGVRWAFGIPGTHNTELYDALENSTVMPVLVTDEQCASFMADAVSRTSNTVGVANVVPGAGVTHCLSGVAEAWMDNIPMVILTCGIRTDTGKAFQLHDVDQLAILRPITKAQLKPATPEEIYPTVRKAFAIARAGTPGPVVVEIAANLYLLGNDVTEESLEVLSQRERWAEGPVRGPQTVDVESAARMLNEAHRPAIYVGNGSAGAAVLVRQAAERLSAPVATTVQGKGVFPEDHPLWLWPGFGNSAPPFVRDVLKDCDVMLAVGCRFGEVATASYGLTPPQKLIHVDIDPSVIGKNYPAALAIGADAKVFFEALLPLLASRTEPGLREKIAEGHRAVRDGWRAEASADRVTPQRFYDALQRVAGPRTVYATDSGNGTFLSMERLRLSEPGCFIGPIDYSCMGYAVPGAVGAKFADPTRDVVALAGDGALLMTGLELLTAARYGVAPVVCVLRDGELGQIVQFQRTTLARDTCSVLHPYSVARFAAAVECEYEAALSDDEVDGALKRAFAKARKGRPVVVEVAIDYSHKTFFTKGVVTTNLWRLPLKDRLAMLSRAARRHAAAALKSLIAG